MMEQKVISFNKGIHRTPSVALEGGELSECVNLIPKNGELVNVRVSDVIDTLPTGSVLLCVHETAEYKHYIYKNGEHVWYKVPGALEGVELAVSAVDLKQVLPLGNSLTFIYDQTKNIAMSYALWTDGGYNILGKMPDVRADFMLDGSVNYHTYVNYVGMEPVEGSKDQSVINTEENFTALMGKAKEYISTNHKLNKFIMPFFVRYALRMTDGSFVNMSEPILMMPNYGTVPIVMATGIYNVKPNSDVTFVSYVADLQMKLWLPQSWGEWEDMIAGLSIGISAPIYKFNQGEEYYKHLFSIKSTQTENYTKENHWYVDKSGDNALFDNMSGVATSEDYLKWDYVLSLPQFSDEEYRSNFIKASVFYRIKDYTLEEIKSWGDGFKTVTLGSGSLLYLETLPIMPDTYNASNAKYPLGGFVYNNRLNIYGVKEKQSSPTCPVSPLTGSYELMQGLVSIKHDGVTKKILVNFDYKPSANWNWYYINNSEAFQIEIRTDGKLYTIPLERHPWLNGAYALVDMRQMPYSDKTLTGEYGSIIENHPNAIYASKASNPFYFPVSDQNLIGTGQIKAVSTSAKAVSQGQFGQFPLYAFATDGIWPLSVDDEGKYVSKNPANRDVVTNPDSICQIDDAVVYASSQGLKMLSGSDTRKLSDVLEGKNVDESGYFSDIQDMDFSKLSAGDTSSIANMLAVCKIMYDPAGGRKLHIYPSESGTTGMHYIYDLDNDVWTTYVGNDGKMTAVVANYPYSIVQVGTQLRQYRLTESNDTPRLGVLLTREMAFDNPFAIKMIGDLRMMYSRNNEETKCTITVYGSNDNVTYKKVTSLRKLSFKWYRFRIMTKMTDLDALTGMALMMEERQTNKLR